MREKKKVELWQWIGWKSASSFQQQDLDDIFCLQNKSMVKENAIQSKKCFMSLQSLFFLTGTIYHFTTLHIIKRKKWWKPLASRFLLYNVFNHFLFQLIFREFESQIFWFYFRVKWFFTLQRKSFWVVHLSASWRRVITDEPMMSHPSISLA